MCIYGVHINIYGVRIYTHTYTYTHTHLSKVPRHTRTGRTYTYIHIYTWCAHIRIHTRIHIHTSARCRGTPAPAGVRKKSGIGSSSTYRCARIDICEECTYRHMCYMACIFIYVCAESSLFYRALLQKRPMILRSLLTGIGSSSIYIFSKVSSLLNLLHVGWLRLAGSWKL